MKRRLVLLVALATAVATAVPSMAQEGDDPVVEFGSSAPVERGEYDSYIVLLKDDPLVVTEGQDNLRTSRAQRRGEEMRAEHSRVMREAGVSETKKVSDYVYALNGFAAHVTYDEALKLAAHKDVALVLPDELMQPHTDASPDFLGLDRDGGAWETGVTGKGVVVGIIDTGIWPEHPSFAENGLPAPPIPPLQDVVADGPTGPYAIPACDFGNTAHHPDDAAFECNNKLVGARQVLPTYRQLIGTEPHDFDSARDHNGHGTHTASTAAGNGGVEASILGNDLGEISGIAPDAHVIAYKGLGALGGFGSDLTLAIDLAIFDGVDVINYSIGGGATAITADEIAFLRAADAGVHVASSAGNSGPGAATIRNPAKVPWLTTVGANTQERFFAGTIELGNGATYEGASITQGVGPAPLVDAADDGNDLCIPGEFSSSFRNRIRDAIVLCRRGAIARVGKSLAVMEAGGIGMIMYENTDDNNLFTDTHFLPTVHIDNTPGLEIKEYIASTRRGRGGPTNATAEIRDTATKSSWPSAPSMTIFSSRGPNVFADVIKPDITAPGIQILAGYSPFDHPDFVQGELFGAIAGTSMSSPHIAGLFALMKQANPDWTPAMARSAMMTTAHQDVVDNDRVSLAGPFAQGAGHADPGQVNQGGSSFQPGLVYDAGINDYLGFLCDAFPDVFLDPVGFCAALEAAGIPTTATDLNYPSIGVSELAGTVTVTRTVTSVAQEHRARVYQASVEAPPGYSVEVSPSQLVLGSGQSATFAVTIINESAPVGEWRFGELTWSAGPYDVRSPIAVRGAALSVPTEVDVTGEAGSSSFDVTFGYTGSYQAAAHGFAADSGESGTVAQDPDQICQCDGTGGPGEVPHTFSLSGSAHLRITMDDSDLVGAEPGTDIDLFLYRNGTLVASSTAPGTDEIIDLAAPADGDYTLWVHGWGVPGGVVDYTFHLWDVPSATGGSLVLDAAPDSATVGETGTIEFSWSGLTAGAGYLGAISHETEVGGTQLTLVSATG
jgi:subtilisin family serine protease